MAAVASTVTQKLAEMVKMESSSSSGKVIEEVKEIKKEVELSGGFLIDEKEEDKTVQNWGRDYLSNLYKFEDAEEITHAVGIVRRRSCYLNLNLHLTLSLKKMRARRKMKQIVTILKAHYNSKPRSRSLIFRAPTLSNGSAARTEFRNHKCLSMNSYEADDSQEEQEHSDADPEIVDRQSRLLIDQDLTKQLNNFPEIEIDKDTEEQEIELHVIPEIQNESIRTSTTTALRRVCLVKIFVRRLHCKKHLHHPKLFMKFNSYNERHVHNLVKQLTDSKNNNNMGNNDLVIPILGEIGSGKTTVARAIYNSESIDQYFNCRAWICVPKDCTKTNLLQSIVKEFKELKGLVGRALISEQVLENKLSEHLKDKRYLVVLDDVCEEDVWEKLKNAFPDTRNGSIIIFTTCKEDVAMSSNPNNDPYFMNTMSDQDSWDMLLSKACLEETSDISSVKDKILKLCKGLPLNIILVGGLLSTKKLSGNPTGEKWLHRVNSWNDSCDIVAICYNDLPAHSKLCLLYLALFPREFDIPVRRLLRLWLAERFVREFQTTTTTTIDVAPEDLVQECFDDLVKRNMLKISKLRSDGSFRNCCLPGHLHDKLFPIARDISLFHIYHSSDQDVPDGVRRVVEYGDIKDCPLTPSQLQNLRSYLSFNIQKKDTPAREVGKFVGKIIGKNGLGLLRVLDLENVYKPSLPENLGDLVRLRYLGLRWTFLDTLPLSIGDLPYLETLDLKHTYIKSLPSSIWKLKHLQHLNLNEIRLDMPQTITSLPPLRTLWGLFVDHNSPVKNGLDRLSGLRELGITFNLSCCKDLIDWVADLTDLQSLRLRSKDESGRPSKLCLKPLSSLKHLSHMNLLGNIQKLPDVKDFPPDLKVLTLSVSHLEDNPMDTLGQLPNLTVLRLLADSFLGKKFVCHSNSFSELRVLKLWMLKKLEEWEVEEGAMKKLRELNIRCCDSLRSIPTRLLQLETFEELILTNMPDEFTATIPNTKLKHTTCKKLDFGAPLPWERR